MEYIITFKNTNFAIKSERYLIEENLHVTVMPLPSQIRAGCGICLRITPEAIGDAIRILTEKNVEEIGMYLRIVKDDGYIYSEITDRSVVR